MARIRLSLWLLAALLWPGAAWAQAPDPNVDAARLGEQAAAAYEAGDSSGAIVLFAGAMSHVPDPAFAFNIAYIYDDLGALFEAWRFYGQYLELYPGAPNRDDIEARREQLRRAFETQYAELRIATTPNGAEIHVIAGSLEVDYGPAPTTVWVAPGEVDIEARLEGHLPARRTLNAVAGVRLPLELGLAPEERAEPEPQPSPLQPWAVGTLTAGAAAVVTGFVFWVLAEDNADEYNDAVAGIGTDAEPPSLDELRDQADRADRQALIGNVLVGVGSALIAGGAVLFILAAKDDRADTTSPGSANAPTLLVRPAGLGFELSGRF